MAASFFTVHWVDANVKNFLPNQARELTFVVCFLQKISAPWTIFLNWKPS
jgi:hypothetical protein